jgi:hypothetical protein
MGISYKFCSNTSTIYLTHFFFDNTKERWTSKYEDRKFKFERFSRRKNVHKTFRRNTNWQWVNESNYSNEMCNIFNMALKTKRR